ncbi:tyrosine-type recombinase/integrase [Chondromyces apiculatus]|uniref:Integrase n=1 Tax=Chondromyces apiculatus DSM 436 TaxID=1192034 RepID=A0A017TBT8_9BACT|nr:site-specific integrase [Chondromyces apiculatus]EYF06041.1 Integrase [Chondromyces apiculatus DSM 436]
MTVRKRGGTWQIDAVVWRGGERVRIRKNVDVKTRNEALILEQQERAKVQQRAKQVTGRAPLFGDFGKEFLETYAYTNNKPSEVETKEAILRLHLRPFFGELRLDVIGPQHIERFKAQQLRAELSPKTVNNQLTVLRKVLAVAKEWGQLVALPPLRLLNAPEPEFDFLTFDEAERLVQGAEPEWRPMVLLALRSGLRQGELLALRWDDIDLESGLLKVRRAAARGIVGTPKNHKSREIPLSDEALATLRDLPSRAHRELVFPADSGRLLTRNECKHPLRRACLRAELRRIGWHVLRHTFASHLVMRGVALKAVQELLGHATIEMTMRYAHLSPDIRRDAVRLLDRRTGDTQPQQPSL